MRFTIKTAKITETKSDLFGNSYFQKGEFIKASQSIDTANNGIISDFLKNGDNKRQIRSMSNVTCTRKTL
jgi:hypothetical protein